MEQNTPPTQPPQKAPFLTEPTRWVLVTIFSILIPIMGLFLILLVEMADNRRATEAQITELRRTTEAQITDNRRATETQITELRAELRRTNENIRMEITEVRAALQAQIDELRRTNENIRIELAKIATILRLGDHQGSNETATKTEPTPPANPTPHPQNPQAAINPAPPNDATDAHPSTGTS